MSTKARLKTAARRLGRWTGRKPRPAILMYHRIARDQFDPWGLCVEQERFAAQVEWLATTRTVLPLSEFARLHDEGDLAPDAIALTFDDGYESVLHALPLLEQHQLHATIFLPVELIERDRQFWWDELASDVIGWRGDTLQLAGTRFSVPPTHPRDVFWPPDTPARTPRQKLFQKLWSMLHAMGREALYATMDELRPQARLEQAAADRPLTPVQVQSVSRSTIAFGSHGLTHLFLPGLPKEDKVREIAESRERCETLTGTAPAAFAYPFGDLDESSVRLVEQAGYACACATGDAFVSARSRLFALPRLRVGNWEVDGLRDMLGA